MNMTKAKHNNNIVVVPIRAFYCKEFVVRSVRLVDIFLARENHLVWGYGGIN